VSVASTRQDSTPAEGHPTNLSQTQPSAAPHGPGPPLQIHQLAAARYRSRKLIKLHVVIAGKPAVCLVDSGASGNFISSSFVGQHCLTSHICGTQEPIKIELADGSQHFANQLLRAVSLTISTYTDCEDFVLLPLGGYDVILGMPWLERLDPCISWRKKSLTFHHNGASHVLESPLALHLMSGVELERAYRKNLISTIAILRKEEEAFECSAITSAADLIGQKPATEVDHARLKMLNEYGDVFPTDLPRGLPPEREVDHRIELTPGSAPPSRPLYRMSPAELDELKKQLDQLLENGFIQPSKSPFG
jgi:hypothetical protein